VTTPDLIELSTDWDTALLVADRYTGLDERYIIEQARQLLAALLLIANKKGHGYEWVTSALVADLHPHVLGLIQRHNVLGPEPDIAVAVETLQDIWDHDHREKSDIFSMAYVLFMKAIEPRSAFDLGELPEPRWLPPERGPNPFLRPEDLR
jgi:hypothetical protein